MGFCLGGGHVEVVRLGLGWPLEVEGAALAGGALGLGEEALRGRVRGGECVVEEGKARVGWFGWVGCCGGGLGKVLAGALRLRDFDLVVAMAQSHNNKLENIC